MDNPLIYNATPPTLTDGQQVQPQCNSAGAQIVSATVDPTGLATSAKQDTQQTSLTAIAAVAGTTAGAAVVTDANGTIQQYLRGLIVKILVLIAQFPASLGRKSSALSLAVVQAGMVYETVAAGQTDQVLGGAGAAGDFLSHIVIQPVTTGAGAVTVKDGASTIYLFTSGTLADLSPKTVPLGILSAGALSVTTGSNVTVLAVGNFT